MELESTLRLIRKYSNQIVESPHFRKQCEDRQLNPETVKTIIRKNEVIGVIEQDTGCYKLWFADTNEKDLNVIVRVLPNNSLKLITVFPCGTERRR